MATNNDVIISGVHIELTEALKNMVHEKVAKLLRHEDQIIRIRVSLEKEAGGQYIAKGHIEIHGPDMHASETSGDLYKSIDQMVEKLDRMLKERSTKENAKQKHPHEVDLGNNIPKSHQ